MEVKSNFISVQVVDIKCLITFSSFLYGRQAAKMKNKIANINAPQIISKIYEALTDF